MKFQKPNVFLLLFSLPFFSVGIGFLILSIIPTLYLATAAPHWDQVPVTLEYAKVERNYGDDSTTYRAVARYSYQYNGNLFYSERVGIGKSADNVGSWQHSRGRELESALTSNRTVLAYVNPRNPSQAILFPDMRWGLFALKMVFVVVFGGFGGLMFVASFLKSPSKPKKNKGKPVKQDSQSDQIYSGARATLWLYLFMAVVFTGVSIPISMAVPDEYQSGNIAILLALVFPLASLFLIVATIKEAIQLMRFGRSPLILSPSPAGIGGHFNATIDVNTPYRSNQPFRVTLCCVHRKTSGSGKNSSTSESTRWVEEGVAYPELNSQNGTRLKFAFNIPENLPETEEPSRSYYFWRLDLEAQIGRTLLKRSFRVPVQKVENPQPATRYLATENPLMESLTDHRLAQLDMDDRGKEIEFRVPRFSYFKDRFFSFLFGSIFLGSGIGVSIAGAPFIFPLFFVPIGLAFCLGSIYALLTEVNTLVREDGIYRRTSFIGLIRKTKKISADEYKEFKQKPAMMWQSQPGAQKHFFTLVAHGENKTRFSVVERVEGKKAAEELISRFEEILYGLKF